MMHNIKNNKQLAVKWTLAALLLIAGLLIGGCTPATIAPTPTPTRTPKPTPTLTPSPTPTPAFPVTVGCHLGIPTEICENLDTIVQQDPGHFTWSEDVAISDIQLTTEEIPNARPVGTWTYALVAPFFTVEDGIAWSDFTATWAGTPSGSFIEHPLIIPDNMMQNLTAYWGAPAGEGVRTVAVTDIYSTVEETAGWTLLPFHQLTPQWKVIRIDGQSPVGKQLDLTHYPLSFSLYLGSATRPEVLDLFPYTYNTFTNRHEEAMTIIAMTGVTAMTRGTGQLMDTKGITYPALYIQSWFSDTDFVHISNEVSFKPDCIAEGSGTMSFCSNDSYIGLLEAINTNIVELTGNHLADKGTTWITHSLKMYEERGWQWFGGGGDLEDATKPLTITHGTITANAIEQEPVPNRIAFIGCNPIGPAYDWATEDSAGSAPCDYEQMQADIQNLREEGYLPIVTLQYLETYEYYPTPQQIRDFRSFANAGAIMVQGSQAHQAQTLEFYNDTFIHYGLGNFFFDQMWSPGTRQEFVDRLTFYNGRLLSIELRTAILEEYGQPRPMTDDYPDPDGRRSDFLQMIFDLRPED